MMLHLKQGPLYMVCCLDACKLAMLVCWTLMLDGMCCNGRTPLDCCSIHNEYDGSAGMNDGYL
jgi:hypothetical protein